MANQQVMRITLKAYDHQLVDASAKKIIETVKKNVTERKLGSKDFKHQEYQRSSCKKCRMKSICIYIRRMLFSQDIPLTDVRIQYPQKQKYISQSRK